MTKSAKLFHEARSHISELMENIKDDRLSYCLVLEAECCVNLEKWTELCQTVQHATKIRFCAKMGDSFAALVQDKRIPRQVSSSVLKQLLDWMLTCGDKDPQRASNWTRIIVEYGLDEDFMPKVFDMARDGVLREEIIHWLAAVLWNHAIDLHIANDTIPSMQWATYAVTCAKHLTKITGDNMLEKQVRFKNKMKSSAHMYSIRVLVYFIIAP